MGRPTKLTSELQERICAIIAETSCTIEMAAAEAGVTGKSLFEWQARGLIEEAGPFREFREALTRARQRSGAMLARGIAEAGKQDWRALAFLIERRFPHEFGNRLALVSRIEKMNDEELLGYIAEQLRGVADTGADSGGGVSSAAGEIAAKR